MDLMEVLEGEEVFQVELKDQELVGKVILEDVVVHLVHQLRIKLEVVVEVLVEQVIQGLYHVVLQEEKVV